MDVKLRDAADTLLANSKMMEEKKKPRKPRRQRKRPQKLQKLRTLRTLGKLESLRKPRNVYRFAARRSIGSGEGRQPILCQRSTTTNLGSTSNVYFCHLDRPRSTILGAGSKLRIPQRTSSKLLFHYTHYVYILTKNLSKAYPSPSPALKNN